jgi:hypothetical protein
MNCVCRYAVRFIPMTVEALLKFAHGYLDIEELLLKDNRLDVTATDSFGESAFWKE